LEEQRRLPRVEEKASEEVKPMAAVGPPDALAEVFLIETCESLILFISVLRSMPLFLDRWRFIFRVFILLA
jgi:hypothetical protein